MKAAAKLVTASRKAGWGVIDQVISSASNFALIAIVARTSDVETFGAFSLAYLFYGLALGGARAIGGEILLLRTASRTEGCEDEHHLLAVALGVSAIGALILVLISVPVKGAAGGAMLSLAAVLPIVLFQDALRYCFFALARPRGAAGCDLIWVMFQVGAFAALLWGPDDSRGPGDYILAWGSAAAVAAAVGLWQLKLLPHFRGAILWMCRERERATRFLTDYALMIGLFYLAIYAVGLVAGLAAVAALRGAQLLFQPFEVLLGGLRIFTLPTLARAAAHGGSSVVSRARQLSMLLAIPSVGWSIGVVLLPDSFGRAVLGETWGSAEPLLLGIAVVALARAVLVPAMDGLRALGGGSQLVPVRLVTSLLIMLSTAAGAALGGAAGAADGLALAFAASTVIWWRGLLRASGESGD